MDDQADVDGGRLARALPGFAEQPRLVVSRQRFRFADVNLGRLEAQGGLDDRVEDVHAGHDHQPHARALRVRRPRSPPKAGAALRRSRAGPASGSSGHIHPDEPDRHRDDVAIARVAKRAYEVREHVRPADRHEEIARPHLHLPQIHDVGRQQLEVVERRRAGRTG